LLKIIVLIAPYKYSSTTITTFPLRPHNTSSSWVWKNPAAPQCTMWRALGMVSLTLRLRRRK